MHTAIKAIVLLLGLVLDYSLHPLRNLQDSDIKRCLANSKVHVCGNSIVRHFAFHLAHALCSKIPGLVG